VAARWCLGLVVGIRWLVACSPYEPSLPPAPFLCGDQEPRCPDGYACVADHDGRLVCRAEGPLPDAGFPDASARTVRAP
jgi:hypothetical protein